MEPIHGARAPIHVQLAIGDLTRVVDRHSDALLMGRNRICDIRVDSTLASRVHACVEWEDDQFYLVDRSRNGTCVITDAGRYHYLRRNDRLLINGKGVIRLGGGNRAKGRWHIRYKTSEPADVPTIFGC